jgi:flagellar hook-basal body complex protein FliE
MNDIGINAVLRQLHALADEARGQPTQPVIAEDQAPFSDVLEKSIDAVNGLQQQAKQSAEAFERGDPQVNLAGVMIAGQKAGLAFQALTQVRNHVLSAYQEIMGMQM